MWNTEFVKYNFETLIFAFWFLYVRFAKFAFNKSSTSKICKSEISHESYLPFDTMDLYILNMKYFCNFSHP